MSLDRTDVMRGLTDLATRLNDAGIEVVIHLVGGAAIMLTVRPDRQSTVDVDSWINTHGDQALHAQVLEAAEAVARANPGFADDWLNDNAQLFIPESVSGALDEWLPLISLGTVTIVNARPDVLLAMKLRAGRGRRDLPDLPALILACGLTTVAEVEAVFERLFPYEEIRASAQAWIEAHAPFGP